MMTIRDINRMNRAAFSTECRAELLTSSPEKY